MGFHLTGTVHDVPDRRADDGEPTDEVDPGAWAPAGLTSTAAFAPDLAAAS
jgi:hypothetical protein